MSNIVWGEMERLMMGCKCMTRLICKSEPRVFAVGVESCLLVSCESVSIG